MQHLIECFIEQLWAEEGLAQNTLLAYSQDLTHHGQWLATHHHDCLTVDTMQIYAYLDFLKHEPVAHSLHEKRLRQTRSISRCISTLRRFYRYLVQEKLRQDNPCEQINQPKSTKFLPQTLSESQVQALLDAPCLERTIELRDKAMLEILYATGLRISELIQLATYSIDLNQGLVRIIGKGNKERLVPMGEEAMYWLQRYLTHGRACLLGKNSADIIFISKQGKMMTRQTFWHRIKIYAQRAQIDSSLSPHTLRHAFATHLINHGADLRVVQLLLGHEDLSSTQIYTHVAMLRLQHLHAQHHPRA